MKGDTYTSLSDMIVMVVIGLSFSFMVTIFVIVLFKK
jgi:hypothetical protein